MKAIAIDLAFVVVIAIAAFALGAHWMSEKDASAISAARGDTQSCLDSNGALQSALDKAADLADQQKATIAAEQADAAKAKKERDAAVAQIPKNTAKRVRALEKTAHETPDCQSLAVLPVCPAVGDRLWGKVARRDTTAGY